MIEEPHQIVQDVIKFINEAGTTYNDFLLMNLGGLNYCIEQLSSDKKNLPAIEDFDLIVRVAASATAAEEALEKYHDQLDKSEEYLESIMLNAESITNAVNEIARLLKKNLLNAPTMDLLLYLAGGLE